jgi:hypothetical protein
VDDMIETAGHECDYRAFSQLPGIAKFSIEGAQYECAG